eukprot:CAMPEP_0201283716 /NCGR_PEP_ID=MMETSP1317-20130820/42439_1 /ASSEMBLY_ACC=CAM_ASM_000770 /TAXON_ID=187299 /ORGANISM="Undescribed Undescribed, Strain Undescribed" /LENGTH=48 /DNA_ID= /DNA_START= /DNA_END= /DNA_ORIENTATION=
MGVFDDEVRSLMRTRKANDIDTFVELEEQEEEEVEASFDNTEIRKYKA